MTEGRFTRCPINSTVSSIADGRSASRPTIWRSVLLRGLLESRGGVPPDEHFRLADRASAPRPPRDPVPRTALAPPRHQGSLLRLLQRPSSPPAATPSVPLPLA